MSSSASSMLLLVLFLLLMYFMMIRPQRKREKETERMRNSIKVGDEVITIGGICGKVVKSKDDILVIQTGADKVKLEMMRWSISKVVAPSDAKQSDEKTEEVKKVKPKKMGRKTEDEVETAQTAQEAEAVETVQTAQEAEAPTEEAVNEATAEETAPAEEN